jgi:hypothetical protein
MLSDITIVIPTFHRRGYLKECFRALGENLPECSVVVAQDDGGDCTYEHNTYWTKLPYDSGLTMKRNWAVKLVETKYTLMGCDDFDFSTPEARKTVDNMDSVLTVFKHVDVVAGRVNERPYEGYLEYVPGEYIREHMLGSRGVPWLMDPVWRVDIAANFFLARTEVLREIPWDESIRPIGGEHVDWFLDLKAANKHVVLLPGANINTQPYDPAKQDPRYKEFRRRALTTGHALMKQKRNIKKYIDFNGGIS